MMKKKKENGIVFNAINGSFLEYIKSNERQN